MKYSISYECRSDQEVFQGNVEIDSQVIPKETDTFVIELALRDSAKFIKSGQAGLTIIDISVKENVDTEGC